jgi:hypothetical protein
MAKTSRLLPGSDVSAQKALSTVGLQDHVEIFNALLIPHADLDGLTRYQASVGMIGVIMTLSKFSPSVVAHVIKQLLAGGDRVPDKTWVVAVLDGVRLVINTDRPSLFSASTLKSIEGETVPEPVTVTTFSVFRAYQLAEVMDVAVSLPSVRDADRSQGHPGVSEAPGTVPSTAAKPA